MLRCKPSSEPLQFAVRSFEMPGYRLPRAKFLCSDRSVTIQARVTRQWHPVATIAHHSHRRPSLQGSDSARWAVVQK